MQPDCFRSVDSVPKGVWYFCILGIRRGVSGATPLIIAGWGSVGEDGSHPPSGNAVSPLSNITYFTSVSVQFSICFGSLGFALINAI